MKVVQISMDIELPDGDERTTDEVYKEFKDMLEDKYMIVGCEVNDVSEYYNK